MSKSTAENFINVATTFGGDSQRVGNLTPKALYLLAAPNTPEVAVIGVSAGWMIASNERDMTH